MDTNQPADSHSQASPSPQSRAKKECPFGNSAFFQTIAESEERLVLPPVVAAVAKDRLPYKLEPKQELMGILSRVISRQWEEASRIRRENPECLGLMLRDFFGAGGYAPLNQSSIKQNLKPGRNQSAMSYALQLSSFMDNAMSEAYERSLCSLDLPDLTPRMESRLSKLLAAGEQMSQGRTLKEIIRGGQATSITATWSFLGALPHLFERLGEDAPSEEQLRKATHAVFRFMTSLAAHHFHAFVGLFQICRTDCQSGTSLMKGGIDSSHVLLAVNNQGDYALCPSTKLARRVIEHVEQRASHKDGQLPTTGCPALFAAAGEGTVVPELLAWVLEVAEKYYFPYVLSTRRRC